MEQNKQSTSSFINGLLIGLAVGAGLVFLLTTKKGKKIIQSISEEGLDSITNLEDLYARFERVIKQPDVSEEVPSLRSTKSMPQRPTAEQKPEVQEIKKPAVLLATDEVINEKLEEVKQRFDKELDDVSATIAQNFVPYADDEEDIEEEETPKMTVKTTRRRFFRGIPRRT